MVVWRKFINFGIGNNKKHRKKMKRSILIKIFALAMVLGTSCSSYAGQSSSPDLKSILSGAGGAIGNIVEGIFTKSDLTVADIAGQWTADGSAVSFKSDDMLKKAGGIAAAGAVESKLDEYYKQYGLNNLVFTVNNDSTFSLAFKKITLKGTISVKEKGIFTLKFTAFGTMSLGSMDAYVEKTGNSLNLMFDADKIKSIISLAANLSGSKLASTADKLLQQYDGICMGFKMKKTGNATATDTTDTNSETETQSTGLDALKGLFKK